MRLLFTLQPAFLASTAARRHPQRGQRRVRCDHPQEVCDNNGVTTSDRLGLWPGGNGR